MKAIHICIYHLEKDEDIPYFILKEIVTASPQDLLNFRTDNSHKSKIINNR